MKAVVSALGIYFALVLAALYWTHSNPKVPVLALSLAFGALGGILRIWIDTRKGKPPEEWYTPAFGPLVGAAMALVLFALLLSGLVSGDVFPQFTGMDKPFVSAAEALRGDVTLVSNLDYFKLIGWSLVAGLSEKFVLAKVFGITGEADEKSAAKGAKKPPATQAPAR